MQSFSSQAGRYGKFVKLATPRFLFLIQISKLTVFILLLFLLPFQLFSQNTNFKNLDILIGSWEGNGSGFSSETSTITSSFKYILDDKFIEVKNNSSFPPSEENANKLETTFDVSFPRKEFACFGKNTLVKKED